MRARDFLVRGLLAGLVAGLVTFAVAFVIGEPPLRDAIAVEQATTGAGGSHGPADDHGAAGEQPGRAGDGAAVPRSLQSTAGLLTGTLVASVTLGGLLGVLSALALGRLGHLGARASTLTVTGIGFTSWTLMPFLAYPPNPPGVGSAASIGLRIALYLSYVAVSTVAAVVAVLVARRMSHAWGGWYASLAAVTGYLLVMLAAIVLMPSYNEVPASFPAVLLYEFRLASLSTQATLWVVVGVVLAELVHRLTCRTAPAEALAEPRA